MLGITTNIDSKKLLTIVLNSNRLVKVGAILGQFEQDFVIYCHMTVLNCLRSAENKLDLTIKDLKELVLVD